MKTGFPKPNFITHYAAVSCTRSSDTRANRQLAIMTAGMPIPVFSALPVSSHAVLLGKDTRADETAFPWIRTLSWVRSPHA